MVDELYERNREDDLYWAAKPSHELVEEIETRVNAYYEACEQYGRIQLWLRSQRMYFGHDADGSWASSSAVTYGGDQGELALLRANQYRSFVQHVHTLVTGTRPALQARAGSNDPDTAERTLFAQHLLEFYFKRKGIEAAVIKTALYALLYGEGWLYQKWDPFLGPEYDIDEQTGRPTYQGDVRVIPLGPIDMIRDPQAPPISTQPLDWVIIRRMINRWDLMAQFPDKADEIRSLVTSDDTVENIRLHQQMYALGDDYVYIYEFFHARTPAMPDGRFAMSIGEIMLTPGFVPLPGSRIPVYPLFPDHEEGSPFGYSQMFDLMAPQEAYDSIISTMVTAHDATGVPNLWTRRGDRLHAKDLSGALRNLQSDEKPEIVQLTGISDHSYKLEELFMKIFENLTGINSVVRGEPQPSLKSGSSLALVQGQAVQFNSGFQRAYVMLNEVAGGGLLETLKLNVSTDMVAEISGESGTVVSRTWTGGDLEGVTGVVVEVGNPALQTFQGRKALAEDWADRGWLMGPEQFAQVMQSGRAEPVYRRDRDHMRLIGSENEALKKGEPVKMAFTDRHSLHIQEHACIFDDPAVRLNDAIMVPTLAHIQEHVDALLNADPLMLQIIGDPMADLLMGPPPEEELPPEEGPLPEGPVPQAPPEGAQGPNMPEMPVNPIDGQRVIHPTGQF